MSSVAVHDVPAPQKRVWGGVHEDDPAVWQPVRGLVTAIPVCELIGIGAIAVHDEQLPAGGLP